MAKPTLNVTSEFGTFTRQTARAYTHLVIVRGVKAEKVEAYRLDAIASNRKLIARYRKQAATGVSDCPRAYSVDDLLKWAAQYEAEVARLVAVGPVTTDKASWGADEKNLASVPTDFGVVGWCGRLDLARKLAEKESRTWREVVILEVETGATVLHIGKPVAARQDGRVDCPACGHHGSACQEDLDNGTTICHTTGLAIDVMRAASLADPATAAALALTEDEVNDLVAAAER